MLPFLSLSTQHIKGQPTHVTPDDQFEEMARFGRAKMKRGDEDWYQRKRASMNKVVGGTSGGSSSMRRST